MEESVLVDDLCGLLGVIVVAEHDHGAFDAYLADARCGVGVDYLRLNAGQGNADGFRSVEPVVVDYCERGALGESVAEYYLNSESVEILEYLRVYRCGAAEDEAH